jgi:hypothetical protein
MASRQREWQKRQVAAGLCMLCKKKRTPRSSYYCEEHADVHRDRERRRRKRKAAKKDQTVGA